MDISFMGAADRQADKEKNTTTEVLFTGKDDSMKTRIVVVSAMIVFALMTGCATTGLSLSAYIDDMYQGREMLMDRNYPKALELFISANQRQPSAAALGFAGATCYRMGEIRRADDYLTMALAISEGSDAVWLILGYKSLVLIQQGREIEGLQALRVYTDLYKSLEPQSQSIADLEEMLASGRINIPYLEVLLDQEVQKRFIDYNKL
jgi:tetratricopeptide (TPR) repeat protein